MTRRIVFLDFDGVLNSTDYLMSLPRPASGIVIPRAFDQAEHLDTNRLIRLCALTEDTDAEIVLSTSWRCAYSLVEIREMFRRRGFPQTAERMIDTTPLRPVFGRDERHHEIRAWLEEQGDPKRFPLHHVVLDDDKDADLGDGSFIHVPDGLEDEHVERAKMVLQGQREAARCCGPVGRL